MKPFHIEHNLKPCPHCGTYPEGWHSRWVLCPQCGAQMSGDNAYKKWNKRLEITQERRKLKSAIREYGEHKNCCAKVDGRDHRYPCTCGLEKALK